LFQYLFAARDQQKRFLVSTCVGSSLRIVLLFVLIPVFGFVGPAIAFVCSEMMIVGIWMVQLARLGFRANLSDVIWRPLIAGVAMTIVLFVAREAMEVWHLGTAGLALALVWQLGTAGLALVVYGVVLLALKTFSAEEVRHAREGLAFFSPFVASWAKKLKRDS
jgi:O-antigen/teichoic acid export membrane protein